MTSGTVEGFGFDSRLAHDFTTRERTKIPLATKPGGASVAVLDSREGIGLTGYEDRDGFVEVAWEVDDGLVFGWIPDVFIDPRGSHRTRPPTARSGAVQMHADSWYSCLRQIPLFVSLAGARVPVGVVGFNPGRFGLLESAPDLTTVETHLTLGLPLVDGAELVIESREMATDCERVSRY